MKDAFAGVASDQHPGVCGAQHGGNPIAPPLRESRMLQDLELERPADRVKRLCEIDFEEQRWPEASVQPPASELYRLEVFVDLASSDECRLVLLDEVLHTWREAQGQALGEELDKQ